MLRHEAYQSLMVLRRDLAIADEITDHGLETRIIDDITGLITHVLRRHTRGVGGSRSCGAHSFRGDSGGVCQQRGGAASNCSDRCGEQIK